MTSKNAIRKTPVQGSWVEPTLNLVPQYKTNWSCHCQFEMYKTGIQIQDWKLITIHKESPHTQKKIYSANWVQLTVHCRSNRIQLKSRIPGTNFHLSHGISWGTLYTQQLDFLSLGMAPFSLYLQDEENFSLLDRHKSFRFACGQLVFEFPHRPCGVDCARDLLHFSLYITELFKTTV